MKDEREFGQEGHRGHRHHGFRGRGPGGSFDLGTIFDKIFEATRDFQDEFRKNGVFVFDSDGDAFRGENTDYYPNYSYPPMNVLMTGDRSLIFEFALAGFEEKDISLSFQGDYMVFSAILPKNLDESTTVSENIRYFKRRLKMKDIEKQKYFVPLDKYAQDKVKAVYKNGILKVTVPPKEEPDQSDGIKIEIVSED
ncbi:MAG: Hsp20/alpha crystallin family protein [Treponema sp.]|nr:Hsp20/alpha crystallin family protein [Treponema sp.]